MVGFDTPDSQTPQMPPPPRFDEFVADKSASTAGIKPSNTWGATRSGHRHQGQDFSGAMNSPVGSADDGEIVFAGPNGNMGNAVKVKHLDGTISVYGHLNKINVQQGDRVKSGASIGLLGQTGNAKGPHVHFELYQNGLPIDPAGTKYRPQIGSQQIETPPRFDEFTQQAAPTSDATPDVAPPRFDEFVKAQQSALKNPKVTSSVKEADTGTEIPTKPAPLKFEPADPDKESNLNTLAKSSQDVAETVKMQGMTMPKNHPDLLGKHVEVKFDHQPTAEEADDAMMEQMGKGYGALAKQFREETGKGFTVGQAAVQKMPDGSYVAHARPTQGFVDAVNAYALGGRKAYDATLSVQTTGRATVARDVQNVLNPPKDRQPVEDRIRRELTANVADPSRMGSADRAALEAEIQTRTDAQMKMGGSIRQDLGQAGAREALKMGQFVQNIGDIASYIPGADPLNPFRFLHPTDPETDPNAQAIARAEQSIPQSKTWTGAAANAALGTGGVITRAEALGGGPAFPLEQALENVHRGPEAAYGAGIRALPMVAAGPIGQAVGADALSPLGRQLALRGIGAGGLAASTAAGGGSGKDIVGSALTGGAFPVGARGEADARMPEVQAREALGIDRAQAVPDFNQTLADREASVKPLTPPSDVQATQDARQSALEAQRARDTAYERLKAQASSEPVPKPTGPMSKAELQVRAERIQRDMDLAQRAGGQTKKSRQLIATLQQQLADTQNQIAQIGEVRYRPDVLDSRYSPTPRFDEWAENESGQRFESLSPEEQTDLSNRYRAEFGEQPPPRSQRDVPPLDSGATNSQRGEHETKASLFAQRQGTKGSRRVYSEDYPSNKSTISSASSEGASEGGTIVKEIASPHYSNFQPRRQRGDGKGTFRTETKAEAAARRTQVEQSNKPPFSTDKNQITLNQGRLLSQVKPGVFGVHLDTQAKVDSLVNELRTRQNSESTQLADAIENSFREHGSVVVATPERLQHEIAHDVFEKRLTADDLARLSAHDVFAPARDALRAEGYPVYSPKADVVHEIIGYISEGRYKELGITRDQAVDFMRQAISAGKITPDVVRGLSSEVISAASTPASEAVASTARLAPSVPEEFPFGRLRESADPEGQFRATVPKDEHASADKLAALIEKPKTGALYDKLVSGQATDSEVGQFRKIAKDSGVSDSHIEAIIGEGKRTPEQLVSDTAQGAPTEGTTETAGLGKNLSSERGSVAFGHIADTLIRTVQNAQDFVTVEPTPKLKRAGVAAEAREHASARTAVPYVVRDLLSKVFPDDYAHPKETSRTIDILNKDNVLGGYDTFRERAATAAEEATDAEQAEKIAHKQRRDLDKNPPAGVDPKALGEMKRAATTAESQAHQKAIDARRTASGWQERADAVGSAQDIAKLEADVAKAQKDKKLSANIDRWKKIVNPEMDRLYNEMKRVDPSTQREGRGRVFGARINLLPGNRALEMASFSDQSKPMPEAVTSNYRNPNVKRDPFMRSAKLTGRNYSTDAHAVLTNVLGPRLNEVTKLRLYDALVRKGVAVETEPGEAPPKDIQGQKASRLAIKVPQTSDVTGKTTIVEKSLYVRADLASEIRNVLNTDMKMPSNPLAKPLTQIQLAQLTDMTAHLKNVHSVLATAPATRSAWTDALRRMPVIGTVDSVARIVGVTREIMSDSPKIRAEMADMAKMGLIRPEYPLTGIQKITRGQQIIHTVDTASRVIMNRFFDNMLEAGRVKDTPENRASFVQQIGEYNSRLMGRLMRGAKESGFSPFVVAGRNFNRQAVRQLTGAPGVEASSLGEAAKMRAVNITSGLVAASVLPALLNVATTGSMGGRAGTPIGAWDLGKDEENGRHRVIDLMQIIGLRRGLRATGGNALVEGMRQGQSMDEILGHARDDVASTAAHPWIGPALGFAYQSLTGRRIDLRGGPEPPVAQNVGGGGRQTLENARTALEAQNPLLYGALSPIIGTEEDRQDSYLKRLGKGLAKGPTSAFGVQDLQSPASKLVGEINREKGAFSRTPDQVTTRRIRNDLTSRARKGEDVEDDIQKAVDAGQLTAKQTKDIGKNKDMSGLAVQVKYGLTLDDALRVWDRATLKERADMMDVISKKAGTTLGKLEDGPAKDALQAQLDKRGIEPIAKKTSPFGRLPSIKGPRVSLPAPP